MTVYVVQEPGANKNILSATKYGDLKFILPAKENMMFSPAPTIARIKNILRNFNDDDFLLLIGDPAAIGFAIHYALQASSEQTKS